MAVVTGWMQTYRGSVGQVNHLLDTLETVVITLVM
jgi:hypothetical protein